MFPKEIDLHHRIVEYILFPPVCDLINTLLALATLTLRTLLFWQDSLFGIGWCYESRA